MTGIEIPVLCAVASGLAAAGAWLLGRRGTVALKKENDDLTRDKQALEQKATTLETRVGDLTEASRRATAAENDIRRDITTFMEVLAELNVGLTVVDKDGIARAVDPKAPPERMKTNRRFDEYVLPDDVRFLEQQERDTAQGVARYGIRRAEDKQHVIVRSKVLARAIESFGAEENSRLILLTPLSKPDTAQLEFEERVKLGSLLTHGIAKQAALVWLHEKFDPEWRQNMMQLLYRRVGVISALLTRWGYARRRESKQLEVGTTKFVDLLTTLSWLGKFVAENEKVRRELEWQNGILSRPCGSSPITYTTDDWKVAKVFTSLGDGAELFIVEELIVNAFRHGAPGRAVRFDIRRTDNDSRCHIVVSNPIAESTQTKESRPYGGQSLIAEACRQCGWEYQLPTVKNGVYEVRLSAPCETMPTVPVVCAS